MICPYCRATKLVKAGYDYQASGKVQRYLCKRCRKITTRPGVKDVSVQ